MWRLKETKDIACAEVCIGVYEYARGENDKYMDSLNNGERRKNLNAPLMVKMMKG